MDDFYKKTKNTTQKSHKKLIVVDDLIVVMLSEKRHNPIVTEVFIRGRKQSISNVFITQSYFVITKILN